MNEIYKKPQFPKTTINIKHLPDHVCRLCKCNRFKTEVMIKYDPLKFGDKFMIPVYTCSDCGELLDLTVTPKKIEG